MSEKHRKHKKTRSREGSARSKSATPPVHSAVPARPHSTTPRSSLGTARPDSRSSLGTSRPDSLRVRNRSESKSKSPSPANSFLSIDSPSSSSSHPSSSPRTRDNSPRTRDNSPRTRDSSPRTRDTPRVRDTLRSKSTAGKRRSSGLSRSSLTGSLCDLSRSTSYSVDVEKASCFIRNWYVKYAAVRNM